MTPRLTMALVAVVAMVSAACGSSPTEPAMVRTGSLVLVVTQPCSLSGAVFVSLESGELGTIQMPGETSFTVPAGRHTLSFRRGNQVFGAAGSAGQVEIVSGGTVRLTDPLGACIDASH